MKFKNLIYICIGAILLIICVGFIYVNMDNGSNLIGNSSKVNNMNNTNMDNLTNSENNSDNYTNTNSPVKNTKSSNNHEGKKESNNIPKKFNNIPKNSKLSYYEALNIAKKAFKRSDAYIKSDTYVKYAGYYYMGGELCWDFKLYSKKNKKEVDGILIQDATGNWQ